MLIFLAIAFAGFILVAGSFFFGHDHDVGHDHDGGDAGHDGDATISIFSTKVLATLLMGFGAAGAIATSYQVDYLVASLIGLLNGMLLGGLMYAILGFFYKQQASSLVSTSSAVGCSGTVTVSIAADGMGEVGVDVEGQYAVYVARSRDGGPIPKGSTVRVVRTVGSQLVVEKESGTAAGNATQKGTTT